MALGLQWDQRTPKIKVRPKEGVKDDRWIDPVCLGWYVCCWPETLKEEGLVAGGGGGQQETMNLKAPLITVLNQALSVEISIQTLHARAFPVHAFRGYHYPARARNCFCFFVEFSPWKQSSKPITEIIQMKILLLPELARELKHKWTFSLDWLR